MKSRASSFKTALWKDVTRFWPVWALYILLHIFIQVTMTSETRDYWYLKVLANSTQFMGIINAGFALASALTLFGDLCNPRMCGGLHSLPLRREEWFGAHLVSGFLFSLIPTALAAVFAELVMVPSTIIANGWQIPLYWWVICNLQYVFFFGLAAFCVMCTGTRFAAAVVYGILNCFSLVLWLLVDAFYTPLLYGVITQSKPFKLLCPGYSLAELSLIKTQRETTGNTWLDEYGVEQLEYTGSFSLNREGWLYLAVLTALGIALLLLARRMYKRRALETAGDFMAVKWLEAPFQVIFTVLCAACVHGGFYIFFGYAYSDNYVMAALGLAAGWFAGRMFLERSTRVFRLKNFLGLGLLTAVLGGSLFVTHLDPLGIAQWVPEAERVESASLSLSYRSEVETEDPETIRNLLRLHELTLEDKLTVSPDYNDYYDGYDQPEKVAYIDLTYWLDNGWICERGYYIDPNSEAGAIVRALTSQVEVAIEGYRVLAGDGETVCQPIQNGEELRQLMKNVTRVAASGQNLPEKYLNEAYLTALADALLADAEAGCLVQSAVYHPDYLVEGELPGEGIHSTYLDFSGENFDFYLQIYADCANTIAVLEEAGMIQALEQSYATKALG